MKHFHVLTRKPGKAVDAIDAVDFIANILSIIVDLVALALGKDTL